MLKRGGITAEGEDFSAVLDSLIWCKFLRKAFHDFWDESAESLNLITGWDVQPDELKKAGERINNLKKLFNIREGWTRADDTLPRASSNGAASRRRRCWSGTVRR